MMGFQIKNMGLTRAILRDATIKDLHDVVAELANRYPSDTVLTFKLTNVDDGHDTQFLTIEAEG